MIKQQSAFKAVNIGFYEKSNIVYPQALILLLVFDNGDRVYICKNVDLN